MPLKIRTEAIFAHCLGVFTGYNLLSVAMTIPQDGKVIGCDISREYFEIGRPLIEEVRVKVFILTC